jgi:plasmid maintenance system antidote protein VapI
MTDALGEWALKMASQGDPQWQVLLAIQSETDLHNLVSTERERKRMRIDDVTLVCISFDQDRSSELPNT